MNRATRSVLPGSLCNIDEHVRRPADWMSLFPRDLSEEMNPSELYWNTYVDDRTTILCFKYILEVFCVNKIVVSKTNDITHWVSAGQSGDGKHIIVGYNLRTIHENLSIVYLFDVIFKYFGSFLCLNSILYDPEQHGSMIPKRFIKEALRDHVREAEARASESVAREQAARRRRARNEAAYRAFDRRSPVRAAADLFDKRRAHWFMKREDNWDHECDAGWDNECWLAAEADYNREKMVALAAPDPGERWVEEALRKHGHPKLLSSQGIG